MTSSVTKVLDLFKADLRTPYPTQPSHISSRQLYQMKKVPKCLISCALVLTRGRCRAGVKLRSLHLGVGVREQQPEKKELKAGGGVGWDTTSCEEIDPTRNPKPLRFGHMLRREASLKAQDHGCACSTPSWLKCMTCAPFGAFNGGLQGKVHTHNPTQNKTQHNAIF